MEKEIGFQYPCLVDVQRNCPGGCELHQMSVRLTLNLANEQGKTPEEELKILRSGTPEMIKWLNRRSVLSLVAKELLDKCQRIQTNDIGESFYRSLI